MALKSIPGFRRYSLCLFSGNVISWARKNPRPLYYRGPGEGYHLRADDGTIRRMTLSTLMQITYGRRAPIDPSTIQPEN